MFFNKINQKVVFFSLLLCVGTQQAVAAQDQNTHANMEVTLEVLKSHLLRTKWILVSINPMKAKAFKLPVT